MSKRSLIEDVGSYFSATMLTQIISLAAAVLTRRYLGPAEMGLWSLLQIFLLYASYSTFGAAESVYREIPFYLGKGQRDKAEEVKRLVYSFSLATSVPIAAGLAVYAFWVRPSAGDAFFYGVLAVAALVVLQKVSNLLAILLLGYKQFSLASRQKVYSAAVNLIFVVVLTLRWKFYGFLAAMLLSFVFNIIYLMSAHRFDLRWEFDVRKIGKLIAYGFPLMLVGLIGNFFLTIDKLMIAKMLGLEALGLYSLAMLAYSYISSVPNAVGVVLIPNFHERFGAREKEEDLRGFVKKSSELYSDVMPFLIAAVWFLVPPLTALLMPAFTESVAPMCALVLSAYFLALMHPYSAFLTVIRKQMLLVPIILAACVLVIGMNYLLIKNGFGLVGVGMATTLAVFGKFTATYFLACRRLFTTAETWIAYALFLGKFALMAAVLLGIRALFGERVSASASILKFGLFTLLYLPTILKIEKNFGIFVMLQKKFPVRVPLADKVVE